MFCWQLLATKLAPLLRRLLPCLTAPKLQFRPILRIRLRCRVESGHVRIRFAATIIAAVRSERFSEFGSATFRQHQVTQIADSAHLAPLRVPAARMSEQTPRCRLDRRRRPRIGSADASGLWPKIQMLSEMQQSFISLHLYLPILRPSRRKTEALRRAGSGPSGFRYQ